MKRLILSVIVIFFMVCNNLIADDFSDAIVKAKKKLGEAMNKNDKASLLKVRGDFERILQLKKNTWIVNYYLASIDFAFSYIGIEEKNNDDVKKYTESSLSLLDKATEANDEFAEAWILKLAVNSNRWIYDMQSMNDIIAKQTEAKDRSKKLEPDNPRFYLIDGMNTYYTPESFGGGVEKAQPLFEKSWEQFQTYKPKDETYPEWGKDQAAGMLALCYVKNEKLDEAKKWIDKGLEVSPESGFIKNYVMKEYEKAGGK
jgi:tetratricopeptide (TPR) repeat protein